MSSSSFIYSSSLTLLIQWICWWHSVLLRSTSMRRRACRGRCRFGHWQNQQQFANFHSVGCCLCRRKDVCRCLTRSKEFSLLACNFYWNIEFFFSYALALLWSGCGAQPFEKEEHYKKVMLLENMNYMHVCIYYMYICAWLLFGYRKCEASEESDLKMRQSWNGL